MKQELIYENALSCNEDVQDFIIEGDAKVMFPNGRMHMENIRDPSEGQKANFVYWCPEEFPPNIEILWDFYPIKEPGLCILFFAVKAINGKDIFDASLEKREGIYDQYHHGDINAFHISYFRRTWETERAFHTCSLRKSYGFHLACVGADPIPSVEDAKPPYHIRLLKHRNKIKFYINNLKILDWTNVEKEHGEMLKVGKIGFRQMAPLVAEYQNLKVYKIIGELNEQKNQTQ